MPNDMRRRMNKSNCLGVMAQEKAREGDQWGAQSHLQACIWCSACTCAGTLTGGDNTLGSIRNRIPHDFQ